VTGRPLAAPRGRGQRPWAAAVTEPQQVMAAQARAGEPPGPEIALNKLALSANMKRLAEFVAAVLGPALVADTGAWGTYAWTSVVLGAPGYRLGGGTDEVLKNAIAQRVLGLPRPA
jgi:alkylation response protein AidB-like acyl-CoA dehydrogenase